MRRPGPALLLIATLATPSIGESQSALRLSDPDRARLAETFRLADRLRAEVWPPPTLLATFPAVGGMATIVVGAPERTGKSSAEWVLALLHEHFHQWQSSLPDYYARADAIGAGLAMLLDRSDGRWKRRYQERLFTLLSP